MWLKDVVGFLGEGMAAREQSGREGRWVCTHKLGVGDRYGQGCKDWVW
jgi:hypothetical protein